MQKSEFHGIKQPKTGKKEVKAGEAAEKKASLKEEKQKLKNIYITLMAGSVFWYLNFAKNPFR